MKHKWTSIGGLIAGIAAVLAVVGKWMSSGDVSGEDLTVAIGLLGAAIAGLKGADGSL